MALYQINRMKLEMGASAPSFSFLDNIFQLMQSPAASVKTFENFSKLLRIDHMFNEIQTGRYQGYSEWERDAIRSVPALGQVIKAVDFDDSMFTMFEDD